MKIKFYYSDYSNSKFRRISGKEALLVLSHSQVKEAQNELINKNRKQVEYILSPSKNIIVTAEM